MRALRFIISVAVAMLLASCSGEKAHLNSADPVEFIPAIVEIEQFHTVQVRVKGISDFSVEVVPGIAEASVDKNVIMVTGIEEGVADVVVKSSDRRTASLPIKVTPVTSVEALTAEQLSDESPRIESLYLNLRYGEPGIMYINESGDQGRSSIINVDNAAENVTFEAATSELYLSGHSIQVAFHKATIKNNTIYHQIIESRTGERILLVTGF